MTLVVRQAHPGPAEPPYHSDGQKQADAEAFVQAEAIPWPVAVDDLDGTVHRAYGGYADAAYLIDADGRVAFLSAVASAPLLHAAIADLDSRDRRGVVRGGTNRLPHLGAGLTDGWRAIRRGWPQSATDLFRAAPGSPLLFWLGHQLRPVLAPLTLRAEPLPPLAKVTLVAGTVALGAWWLAHRRRPA